MSSASGIVQRDGTVTVLGRRFWSPELWTKHGWEVLVEIDHRDEAFASIWDKGRMHRLSTAVLIADVGFGDLDAARAAAALARDQRASVVRGQIAALLNILDQRVERTLKRSEPVDAHPGHGRIRDALRRLRQAWRIALQQGADAHEQTAHGIDPDLEKIEAILQHSEPWIVGHAPPPSLSERPTVAPAEIDSHCLSGDTK